MLLGGVSVGVVMTGSHCTIEAVIPEIKAMKNEGAIIRIVFSYALNYTDNRFNTVEELRRETTGISEWPIIDSIVGAEPIGPHKLLDIIIVAPCTGNTLAKLANGITDTPALMAVKGHLRNQRPVVIAVASNDGLGLNARNLGHLLNAKHIYFVPFRQDDPIEKSTSIIANMSLLSDTVRSALQGKQLQPLLLGPSNVAG